MSRLVFSTAVRATPSPWSVPTLGLRSFATTFRREVAAATETATPSSASPATPPSSPPRAPPPYPFVVGRTASQNLPVYQRKQSGGTRKTTLVKRVEGNVAAFAEQLRDELQLEVTINQRTRNQVVVKGHHRQTVLDWLKDKQL